MKEKLAVAILTLAVFIAGFLVHSTPQVKFGGAQAGVPAAYAVATTTLVGPQQNIQIFAASACSARVVSTAGGSAVTLIFFDPSGGDISSTTLNGAKGVWQGSSTTVAYDASLYGCGRVFAFAYSSSTLNLIETR